MNSNLLYGNRPPVTKETVSDFPGLRQIIDQRIEYLLSEDENCKLLETGSLTLIDVSQLSECLIANSIIELVNPLITPCGRQYTSIACRKDEYLNFNWMVINNLDAPIKATKQLLELAQAKQVNSAVIKQPIDHSIDKSASWIDFIEQKKGQNQPQVVFSQVKGEQNLNRWLTFYKYQQDPKQYYRPLKSELEFVDIRDIALTEILIGDRENELKWFDIDQEYLLCASKSSEGEYEALAVVF